MIQTPNQAMQRTASQPAIYFLRVCHPHFDCVARFTGLAVADLGFSFTAASPQSQWPQLIFFSLGGTQRLNLG
jgi:hypothetical protein